MIREVGFPWAMRTCGFLFLGLLIVANFTVESRVPPKPRPWKLSDFVRPFSETPFLLTTLGLFCFSWGVFIPFNFLAIEAEHRGMTSDLANYQISILNGVRYVILH